MLEHTTEFQVEIEEQEQAELELKKKKQRGQGFTEYIILVGVIAILLIGTITAFKEELQNTFNTAEQEIADDVRGKMENNDNDDS